MRRRGTPIGGCARIPDSVLLPAEIDFQLADLQAFFFKASTSTAHGWIKTLVAEKLIERVDAKQGYFGYIRVRVFDSDHFAEPRVLRGNAQVELNFDDLADTVPLEAANDAAALAEVDRTELSDGQLAEPATNACSAGDAPTALCEALVKRLGAARVDLWLGDSRWEFGDVGLPAKLFLPDEFKRATVASTLADDLRASVKELGFVGLEIEVDLALKELRSARVNRSYPRSKPTDLAGRSISYASTSQPANDFWFKSWENQVGPCPAIIAEAKRIYDLVGDATMQRGIGIHAAVYLEHGFASVNDVERLAAEHPCDFNTALKQLLGKRWMAIGSLKSYLKSRHRIAWRRQWDGFRQPRNAGQYVRRRR